MTLNASGPISLAGSTAGESIAVELGLSATGQISLNDAAVRGLAGVASGAIVMPTDFYGKSNIPSGELYLWGQAQYGIFLGPDVSRSSPVQVSAFTDWTCINASVRSFLGVRADGTLWSWGGNYQGQLGHNDRINRSSPVQVGALTTWRYVISSSRATLAVKKDGTLWAWGNNNFGQLGLNDQILRSSPVQVGVLTNWSIVQNTYSTGFAVKTDGTLWSWGNNSVGHLGLNDTITRSSPTQIGGDTDWRYVGSGVAMGQAVKTNGTLWSWGFGSSGRTGLNTSLNVSSPTQVGALTTWQNLKPCAGGNRLATKTDGTLWAWGNASFGALGINSTQEKSSPVQVGALTNWSEQTTPADYLGIAVKTDGTLWTWGRSANGRIGNDTTGNYSNVSSPIQIGALSTWTLSPEGMGSSNMGAAAGT